MGMMREFCFREEGGERERRIEKESEGGRCRSAVNALCIKSPGRTSHCFHSKIFSITSVHVEM